MASERSERPGWGFERGAEIAPGRRALEPLGGGSRYEAWLVFDERLLALMVAKVLRPDQVDSEGALEDLAEEAEALERLAHPVLVRGFGAVLDGPHPHVLIEHLEGPTLRSLIKRHGALPPEQLLPLALHVAAAVHYVGAEGWVHLDVKPDNIVMGVPPRLIDLSVARPVERAARIGGPVGTDAYMAPEQCDPQRFPGRIGPASDVFGLAATLHHALTGERPFPRPREARESVDPEVRFPQLVGPPTPLPERLPATLREIVTRGLAYEPEQRPSAGELAAALEPLVAELPRRLVLGRRGARAR